MVPPAAAPAAQRVLITDGDARAALACARSLVAAGHTVFVAAESSWSLAGVSRGVRPLVVTASPLAAPQRYAEAVGALCTRLAIDVLLPVSDAACEAVLAHRTGLDPRTIVPLPSLATFHLGGDKARMLALARQAGFAVPASIVIAAPEEMEPAIAAAVFPAIVKPHRSIVPAPGGGARKLDVAFVPDAVTCRATLRALPHEAYPVLIQERIRGRAEGAFGLRWGGALVATFAHRRVRERPPAGGVSVLCESIPLRPAVAASTAALLAALDWQGVAMIECKVDDRSGEAVFMELNGRPWGSLQLAIDAGVDFPALLVACASGAAVADAVPFEVGARSRWFWGDLDHLGARLLKSPARLHLESPVPSRLAVLLDFLRVPFSRARAEVGRWHDPLPALLEGVRRVLPAAPRWRNPFATRAARPAIPALLPAVPAPSGTTGVLSRGPSRRRSRTHVSGG